ncbi:phospholipase [Sulfurimonas aquatica]|uniref:Phosphatidylcholine 1-acylhydrolase n=1 Tax=Sulfurimonas aquatica TaxID=2672570 RepID=A0A975GCB7_9BACT|nr:phospholipase A [Sulfurimonas aquatica]QSZ41556.1 phospholipase [Sulfurimonas aquatica]
MKLIIAFFLTLSLYAAEMQNDKNLDLDVLKPKHDRAKVAMNNWLDGNFGLKPYKTNYILPYGIQENKYDSFTSDDYINVEAELQVSFKLQVAKDFFNLDERYFFSYTHRAFWQIYTESSPFRETNYSPEVFVVIPINDESIFKLRSVQLAYAHTSNGQGESHDKTLYTYHYQDPLNQSRSLNMLYAKLTFQHDTLVTDLEVIHRMKENIENDDNPSILYYIGFAELKLNYFLGDHMMTLKGRLSPYSEKGSVEYTHSYPAINDTYFYLKVFSGYGESLIDYDKHISKASFGFSFSR